MEDGTPFCRQCGAPQIRVPGIEALEPPALAPSALTPSESSPEPPSTPSLVLPEQRVAGVQWAHALPGAALGGVASLLFTFPFAVIAPAIAGIAFFLGGALAVRFYRRHVKGILSAGIGAKVGAASGAFAFLFAAIVMIAGLVYNPNEMRQTIAQQWSARGLDAQKLRELLDQIKTPEGLTSLVVTLLIYAFFVMVVGSSIGGALYAAWARRRAQM